jgi:hypothetical protein
MKKSSLFFVFLILLLSNAPYVFSQETDDFKNYPNYVDFNQLDFFKNHEKKVEVYLRPPLLKFAAKAASKEDPELSNLLENIKLISVNVFQIDDKIIQDIKIIINDVSKKLKSKNWENVVSVKNEKDYVEIYTQIIGDKFSGIVIMAVNGKEAVFVNVIGDIRPEQLEKLGGKFNIPNLKNIDTEKQKETDKGIKK